MTKALQEGSAIVNNYRNNVRGQDALDQQQHVMESLDEAIQRNGQGLLPQQKARYDAAIRRYQFSTWNGEITTHGMKAGKEVATSTNKGMTEQALNLAAKGYGAVLDPNYDPNQTDPNAVDPIHMARTAALKQLHWEGLDTNPDIVRRTLQLSDHSVYKTAIEAKFAAEQNPIAAANDVKRLGPQRLGEFYAPMLKEFEARADNAQDHQTADQAVKGATIPQAPGVTGAGKQSAATPQERPPAWQFATKPNAHTDRNLFSSGAARRMGIEGGIGQNLVSIGTNPEDGTPVRVNARAAPHFAGFIRELEGMGYKINSLGGYNDRMIRGTRTPSEHAFGNAIDINPDQNPQGGGTNLPPNVSAIAAKYGLIWGGDWSGSSRDPMHFEWSGKGTRIAGTE